MIMNFYTDYRLGGIPRYSLSAEEDTMLIPDEVRKCVVFLLYLGNDKKYYFAGTGFLISVEIEFKQFVYLVTAKHVIVGIQKKSVDGKVYIRMNDRNGGTKLIASRAEQWIDHPEDSSVDACVFWVVPPSKLLDYFTIPITMVATDEKIKDQSIGIGDEVFITGLFVYHYGKDRNTPIIRVGNIASMPEEKVDIKDFGSIDAYLIESRSIGGLSGSPVFVHLGIIRNIDGKLRVAPATGIFYLLGLIHGHWDREENDIDSLADIDIDGGKINMGIAIVVPATKILEIINKPEWIKERQTMVDEEKKKTLPTEDLAEDKNEKGEITREEFEEILKKISRPLKPDDREKKGT